MKTQTTKNIEYLLFKKTNILGTYGCREVKIGGVFTKQYITPIEEYVDYMTITSKGKITCYEIKVSKEDLYSSSALSFHGHSNFIVMPEELYNEVKDDGEFLRKLKNNFILRPFEALVKMYSIPDYKETDPTPFFAITY